MRLKILIIYCFLLGCSSSKTGIPEGILPEKELVSIIKEVHLVEANFELLKSNGKGEAQNTLLNNYQKIYKKFKGYVCWFRSDDCNHE